MVKTKAQKEESAFVLRGQRSSVIDQLVNLESLIEKYTDAAQISSSVLLMLNKKLNGIEGKYLEIHNQLLEVIEEEGLGVELLEAKQTDLRFQAIQVEICKFVDKLVITQPDNTNAPQPVNLPKLPDLKLIEFTGKCYDWDAFKDIFISIVDKREDLDNISKFRYLKGCLGSEAGSLIAGLRVTNENYSSAWTVLKEKYENRPLAITTLINELLTMKSMESSSSSEINRINLKTNTISTNLCNMDFKEDKLSSAMIVEIVSGKLESKLREQWEIIKSSDKVSDWKTLSVFLDKQVRIKEQLESHKKLNKDPQIETTKQRSNRAFTSTETSCPACTKQHKIHQCADFKQLSMFDRSQLVLRSGLCFNCLDTKEHQSRDCSSKYGCRRCSKKHHYLLHRETRKEPEETKSEFNGTTVEQTKEGEVLLATAIVFILDNLNNKIPCRTIVDTASHSSFISSRLAKRLRIKISPHQLETTGLNGTITAQAAGKIKACVQSRVHDDKKRFVEFVIINNVTGNLPTRSLTSKAWNIPKDVTLADPQFFISNPVDMLLGADVFFDIIQPGVRKMTDCTIINSDFGWLIGGKLAKVSTVSMHTCLSTQTHNEDLNKQLSRFWELEENDELRQTDKTEELICEEEFFRTHTRTQDGQYVVKIPLKKNLPQLGDTYHAAERQLNQLVKQLNKNPAKKELYVNFINEYKNLHHMEKVIDETPSTVASTTNLPISYLPHHGILKMSSSSTKLRVVFNASQPSSTGVSLNDLMMNGGVVQPSLFEVFLRFRVFIHVFCADITKMYRMILIQPDQQDMQRILWKENETDETQIYRLRTVTYGTTSAPYLATRVLNQLALDGKEMYPRASEALLKNTYVDDIMTGHDDMAEAQLIRNELIELLSQAKMSLHKWCSNTEEILDTIEKQDCEPTVCLNDVFNAVVKTLGIIWDPLKDAFTFKVQLEADVTKHQTKRKILSRIASIFDPIGLLAPLILKLKVFMQNLWKQKNLGWDSPLSEQDEKQWTEISSDLQEINLIEIPRCIKPILNGSMELHGFADASSYAYGACVYLINRSKDNTLVTSRLVAARSKVGPMQPLTIPRMELQAATMLSTLINQVQGALNLTYTVKVCWSDSTTVLGWIKTAPEHLKQFCSSRVQKICKQSNEIEWKYVSTTENPADIVSRGCNADQLNGNQKWFNGPKFLINLKNEFNNPNEESAEQLDDYYQELKTTTLYSLVTVKSNDVIDTIINKFSNLRKLEGVFAYVLRFVRHLQEKVSTTIKKPTSNSTRKNECHAGPNGGRVQNATDGHPSHTRIPTQAMAGTSYTNQHHKPSKTMQSQLILTVGERFDALKQLTKYVQSQELHDEIHILANPLKHGATKSKITNLSPYIDQQGLLRVGGRLANMPGTLDIKHPMILPHNHTFTKLMIRTFHEESLHIGQQGLLAHIRQMFWPIHGKTTIRQIVHSCVICYRTRPSTESQFMGHLPKDRVEGSFPFMKTGVDFGGPYVIKDGQGRTTKTKKVYIAVFVCFATKAVHIELVNQLTTEDFIATLKRFFSRRGISSDIFSDNATNFKGSAAELDRLIDQFNSQQTQHKIAEFCVSKGSSWHFIPPRSPHFGGIWEASIKSVKYHLKRVLGSTLLRADEMITLLTQIEAILNSRPLMELSNDPTDLTPLTPAHFLIGRLLNSLPEPDLTDVIKNRLDRWQQVQLIHQGFWKRWQNEYLTTLQQRHKWNANRKDFKVGMICLLKEDNVSPLNWRLGKIIKVTSGADNNIRVVTLRTAHGEVTRAVTKICLLPITDNEESTEPSII